MYVLAFLSLFLSYLVHEELIHEESIQFSFMYEQGFGVIFFVSFFGQRSLLFLKAEKLLLLRENQNKRLLHKEIEFIFSKMNNALQVERLVVTTLPYRLFWFYHVIDTL